MLNWKWIKKLKNRSCQFFTHKNFPTHSLLHIFPQISQWRWKISHFSTLLNIVITCDFFILKNSQFHPTYCNIYDFIRLLFIILMIIKNTFWHSGSELIKYPKTACDGVKNVVIVSVFQRGRILDGKTTYNSKYDSV